MKLFVTIMLTLSTLTALASNLQEDLSSKKCGIKFNKTIFMTDSDPMASVGRFMFAPLINERNVLLKKGSIQPIVEIDDEVITINERENIIFLCITDESEECSKLSSIKTADFSTLADNNLEVICE